MWVLVLLMLSFAQDDAVKSVPKADGQVGVESVQKAGVSVGWLVDFESPDGGAPVAGTLIVWKGGHVIRRFETDQTFWSWSFVNGARAVAYHTGPMHGERKSHCELRDVAGGRLLVEWDGDLESPHRPPWTSGLKH